VCASSPVITNGICFASKSRYLSNMLKKRHVIKYSRVLFLGAVLSIKGEGYVGKGVNINEVESELKLNLIELVDCLT